MIIRRIALSGVRSSAKAQLSALIQSSLIQHQITEVTVTKYQLDYATLSLTCHLGLSN